MARRRSAIGVLRWPHDPQHRRDSHDVGILRATSDALKSAYRLQKGAFMTYSPRMHYKQGDHVCTLYSTREEQMAAAVEYIRGGLSRGERCLYVVGEHTPDEFRTGLREAGIDV